MDGGELGLPSISSRIRTLLTCALAALSTLAGGVRLELTGLTGKRVIVRGNREERCALCFEHLGRETENYECGCGAVYHEACSRFRTGCIRCDEPVAARANRQYRMWLPKRPVFGTGIEESILAGVRCMACDTPVSVDAAYCGECGFHLSTMAGFACMLCYCEVREEDGFCRYCGTIYANAEKRLYQCPCCSLVSEEGSPCSCGLLLHTLSRAATPLGFGSSAQT